MLLKKIFEMVATPTVKDNNKKVVTSDAFDTRIPGIIYRWMSIGELQNIYKGDWAFLGFDEYGEEDHPKEFDNKFFKSFSTHLNEEQNDFFFDDLLVAFDEHALETLVPRIKLVDYEYEEHSKENEKRLIYNKESLPKTGVAGKYWKAIKLIYVPASELNQFDSNVLLPSPKNPINTQDLPPWFVIKGM